MAKRDFSWYSAKQIRFDSSALGIVSEVASLTAPGKCPAWRVAPMIQAFLAASLVGVPWANGADVELLHRTVKRCALAVHVGR